jgi:hypothetical protein
MKGLFTIVLPQLIDFILGLILNLLTREEFEEFVKKYVSKWKQTVVDSENGIDDQIVLPLLNKLLEILNIPTAQRSDHENGLIYKILREVLELIEPADFRKFVDKLLDSLEEFAQETTNEIDDKVAKKICDKIRSLLEIDDDDLFVARNELTKKEDIGR